MIGAVYLGAFALSWLIPWPCWLQQWNMLLQRTPPAWHVAFCQWLRGGAPVAAI